MIDSDDIPVGIVLIMNDRAVRTDDVGDPSELVVHVLGASMTRSRREGGKRQ